jgi:hypothetical protein
LNETTIGPLVTGALIFMEIRVPSLVTDNISPQKTEADDSFTNGASKEN